jgi:hypothetical protein
MTSERTWSFNYEGVPVGGFDNPPPGHYTMEIADTIFKLNSKGERYLSMVYDILDSDNAEWVGKKYFQYVSLEESRLRRTKADFAAMGVPPESQTNDGGPDMMIGTVFETDLIETVVNEKPYTNMRNIKPMVKAATAEQASTARAAAAAAAPQGGTVQPKPARATASGRR